jgi:hypothetical protein
LKGLCFVDRRNISKCTVLNGPTEPNGTYRLLLLARCHQGYSKAPTEERRKTAMLLRKKSRWPSGGHKYANHPMIRSQTTLICSSCRPKRQPGIAGLSLNSRRRSQASIIKLKKIPSLTLDRTRLPRAVQSGNCKKLRVAPNQRYGRLIQQEYRGQRAPTHQPSKRWQGQRRERRKRSA